MYNGNAGKGLPIHSDSQHASLWGLVVTSPEAYNTIRAFSTDNDLDYTVFNPGYYYPRFRS